MKFLRHSIFYYNFFSFYLSLSFILTELTLIIALIFNPFYLSPFSAYSLWLSMSTDTQPFGNFSAQILSLFLLHEISGYGNFQSPCPLSGHKKTGVLSRSDTIHWKSWQIWKAELWVQRAMSKKHRKWWYEK